MQREDVVHAIAGHGDGMALILQRHDELLLLRGTHAPEDATGARRLAELLLGGHGAHVDAFIGIGHAHGSGDVRYRLDRITADDVDAHALLLEVVERLGCRGAHAIANEDERERLDRPDDLVFLVEVGDLGEHEHATHARKPLDLLEHLGQLVRPLQDEFGRTHGIVAGIAAVADARILALGGERHVTRLALHGLGSIGALFEPGDVGLDGLGGLVIVLRERVKCDKRVQGLVIGHAIEGNDLVDVHLARGDGTRLVEAHNIDASERLDAVQLLDEHLVLCETNDAHGEHGRGQQDEPLRNHPDERCRGMQDRRIDRAAAKPALLDDERGTEGHDENGDELDDLAQRLHDVGAHLAIDLGLVVDFCRVVVRTHGGDARDAGTGADEASGVQLVAHLFWHEVRLAREQALVSAARAFDDLAVRRHLIATLEHDDVIEDDLVEHDVHLPAVTNDVRLG